MYYSLDFRIIIIKKGEIMEAIISKFIWMMPKTQVKNQESSKFQSAGLASHPLSEPLLWLSVRKNLEEG